MPPFSRQDPGKGSKIKKFEIKFETKLWDCSTAAKHRRKNCDVRDGQVRSWDLLLHQMVTSTWPTTVSVEPSWRAWTSTPHPQQKYQGTLFPTLGWRWQRPIEESGLHHYPGVMGPPPFTSDSEGHMVSVRRRSYPSQPEWYQRRFTGKPGLPSPT